VCFRLTFVSMPSVFDEIRRRSLNFVRSCIRHESAFVQFIALHGLHVHSRSLRVAFLRELIMIRDSSLTFKACDKLNDFISPVCTS